MMHTYLFSRLSHESEAKHPWCGNFEKGNAHHGVISLAEDPTTIKLSWKTHSGASPQYVGTYELHLKNLLDCGVIRKEKSDSVRVKFLNVNGLIVLSTGHHKPYLLVGTTQK